MGKLPVERSSKLVSCERRGRRLLLVKQAFVMVASFGRSMWGTPSLWKPIRNGPGISYGFSSYSYAAKIGLPIGPQPSPQKGS